MRQSRVRLLALAVALGALFYAGASNGILARALLAQQPAPADGGLSPAALAQIQALFREKQLRSGGQLKIDSRLIVEMKRSYGDPIAGALPVATGLPFTADDRLVLDIRARVTDALLDTLSGVDADVVEADRAARHLRVRTDLWWLEAIASLPEVDFIQPKEEARTVRFDLAPVRASEVVAAPQPRRRLDKEALVAAVRRALEAQGAVGAGTGQGSQTSQGDATHRADSGRATYGVTGAGVKIGVLSDGVAHLSSSQALGDLGAVTVLAGQTGSGDEGTAMLEIIHDLAPGAQLYFATAFTSITSFAQNIRNLRAAGCDIIVDDVYYYVESPFQDGQAASVLSTTNGGVVSQAVKDVTASGALYFSSAGNSGNLDAGTSGTWEGDFVDGGPTSLESGCPVGCRVHSFGSLPYDTLAANSGYLSLFWSDPLGGSANDYDLIVTDSSGSSVLTYSLNVQSGTQDPFEFAAAVPAGSRIYIVRYAGSGRFLHLDTDGGILTTGTAGVTKGHAATSAPNSFGVAATRAVGPYPGPFNTGNTVEYFSSDGPRRVFFTGAGAPFTPGNFGATGGVVLSKPDLTAADGVSVTGVGGFPNPFYGTSAAAPHAGAIAALVKSAYPSLTASQIRSALLASIIDIQASGWDRDSGAGIVMADGALAAASASAPSLAVSATVVSPGAPVTVTLTNGTGVALDWLALALHTAPDTSYVQYQYVGAVTGTTWTVAMPATLGTYEFRLFGNNGYTRLSTSPTVMVAPAAPVPTIGSLAPSAVAAGSADFTLTVNGTGFLSGLSQVQWDGGTSRTPTVISPTQLTVAMTAADVASQGTHTVTVSNPSPGGGVSSGATFTVTAPPPAPIITSISPSSTTVLGPAFPLTVNGTGFAANSTVRLNAAARATTYISSTQLIATIPASDLTTASTATITVLTPAPGGGTSNGAPLSINGPSLNVSATLLAPGAAVTVTLTNGAGGPTDWLALANSAAPDTSYLQYRYVGSGLTTTTWTVTMPAALGTYQFRLFSNNGYARLATSPTVTVANINPVPAIGSLNPSGLAAGSAPAMVTINGTGFVSGSSVQSDGAIRPTTFVSATQLQADLAADVVSPGTHAITVFSPTPGGGTSNGVTFTATAPPPVPIVTTISPTSVAVLSPGFPLTVNGTGFAANSVVRFNGVARATAFVSSTQLVASILSGDLTDAGTATITVVTPAPGGGTSNGASLAITGPSLGVSATLVPPGTTVTVTLSNGAGGATDWLALAATAAPDTSYLQYQYVGAAVTNSTFSVPMPMALGTYEFRLYSNNSYVRLAKSPAITVANINPTPAITGLSPSGIAAGSSGFTLTVNGTGFVTGVSKLQWDGGSDRTPTILSASQLTVAIPASDVVSQGTHTVTVSNPSPGGGTSSGATFTVTPPPPVPTITTISPTSVPILGVSFPLTVNGTGFAPNSIVRFNGADRTTTYASATQLIATIPASDLTSATTATITVFTPAPGGGLSNGSQLTITGPSLSVSATTVQPGTMVTVTLSNGAGGVQDWIALAAGTAFDTTYLQYRYVGAGLTTTTWTVAMPLALGTYEFRLYSNNSYTRLATSPAVTVANINPVPSIGLLSPASVAAGSPLFTLTVNGTGFVSGASSVLWDGSAPRSATVLSSTQLLAQITAAEVASASTHSVSVVNSAPGGGTSNGATFTVTPPPPAPTLTSISPNTVAVASTGFTLTAIGTNFTATSVVQVDGLPRSTVLVDAAHLVASLPAGDRGAGGTHAITVYTPGGGTSGAVTLTVTGPTITAAPATVFSGGSVVVTVANGPGSPLDWVGFYCPTLQPDGGYSDFVYLNGSRTTPPVVGLTSATVTLIAPMSSGTYCEARWFRDNGYSRIATSNTVSLQATSSAAIALSTASAAPGTVVTATLSNGLGGPGDFLALAATAAGNTTYLRSMPLTTGQTTKIWSFPLPRTAGVYEVRLFTNNGTVRLATSPALTATGAACMDSDGDGLCDAYETNTGVYISPTDTGTNPTLADTDGDNVSDGDEVFGTAAGLNLPGMGANPLRKNIFLEYDWFDDNSEPASCIAHTHRPTQAMLDRVSASFAASPVTNPDGSTGVTMIHDYGQGGVFTGGGLVTHDGNLVGGVNSVDFQNVKAANFAANRRGIFHYVEMAHYYTSSLGSSGQAELPGNDLIVTLGCFVSTNNVANTIMHELGHNLSLQHGGGESCNWKPNYNSVMNYRFQFQGIDVSGDAIGGTGEVNVLDYSRGTRISLNENSLNESLGVNGATPIDWNFSGTIESGVTYDLNRASTFPGPSTGVDNSFCAATLTTLNDYNDWAHVLFNGLSDADGAVFSPVPPTILDCLNPAMPKVVPPELAPRP